MKLEPSPDGRGICVETPLRLRFDRPQRLGTAGAIDIRRADGRLADRIDLAGFVTNSSIEGDADFIWGVGNGYYCQIRNDDPAFVLGEREPACGM